ncbi:hypothetical protein ACQCT5_10295 [Sutcliffiella halmapala]
MNLAEREAKILELGKQTKALLELHLENPKEYSKEYIMERLFNSYERMELDLEK